MKQALIFLLLFAKIKLNFVKNTSGRTTGSYGVTVALVNGNYAWSDGSTSSLTYSYSINKITLTVTAENKTITYGDEAPTYTATYSGFISGENESVLKGTLTFECPYTKGSDAGTYTIKPTGLDADNYTLNFVNGTLTVSKQSVAKPTSAGKTYTYNNANQTFVLNNFDANTMTVSNNVQKNADTYTVTVSLKDTANYQWADGTTDPLTFSFVINKKEINLDGDKYTITWDGETGSTGTDFTYYWANTLIAPVATITDLETTEEINLKFVSSNIQGLGGVNKWNAGDYKAIISQSTALESENYTLVGSATFEQRYKISKILLKVGGEQYDNYTSGGITTTNNAKLVKNYTIYTAGATLPSGFTLTVTIDDGSGATAGV